MSIISATTLVTNRPNQSGMTVLIRTSNDVRAAVFNYTAFPAQNVGSTSAPGVETELWNRSLNVGSPECTFVGEDTGTNEYIYSLLVQSDTMLPNHDYYVSFSGAFIDGTVSSYSSPLLLPIAAEAIVLSENDVTITRDPYTYATQATIKVFFEPIEAPLGSAMTYTLGIQYNHSDETIHFMVSEPLFYNPYLGGVEITITDEVDEAYVAIQSIRTVLSPESKAISQLSNTVAAKDTQQPDPPRDLTLEYLYNLDIPLVNLYWLAPFTAAITDVTQFVVYRKVEGVDTEYVPIGDPVAYVSGQMDYTFQDDTIGQVEFGKIVRYYVTSENATQESGPSNIVSLITIQPSTEPRFLRGNGLKVTFDVPAEQDVAISFLQSAEVYGSLVYDYQTAYYQVDIYDNNDGSPHFGELIATQNVDFVIGENHLYTASFNNIYCASTSQITDYFVKCKLITFSLDGTPIEGVENSKPFTTGPAPIYVDINGNGVWTQDTGLSSYRIITAALLSTNSTDQTTLIDDGTHTGRASVENIPVVVGAPTGIVDDYSPYAGCYYYDITVTPVVDQLVVALHTSNAWAMGQVAIQQFIHA